MRLLFSKIALSLSLVLTLCACGSEDSNQTIGTNPCKNSIGNYSMCEEYILPPMPDKKENDKTLLGIDSNNNGVRDDVEIWIYNRFKDNENYRVDREIAMQWTRAFVYVISNDPFNAYINETYKVMDRVHDCQWYFYETYLEGVEDYGVGFEYRDKHNIYDELDEVYFNTEERIGAYGIYNYSLGGNTFSIGPYTKDNCDFDIDAIMEMRQW